MPNKALLYPEEKHLVIGLDYIASRDADFAKALGQINPIPPRSQPPGFETLSKIIIEQQVSLASADAIWKRLQEAVQPFTPKTLLNFTEEELRSLGLSKQKAIYCRALASDIDQGTLTLEDLPLLPDQEAMDALISVKGIGRWTAEVYLISCLKRADVWPAGDVALKIAMQHLKNLPERPTVEEMDHLAEPLKPYRTLGARVLWRYYADVVKGPKSKK